MRKIVLLALATMLIVITAAGASAHDTSTVELVTRTGNGGWACDDGIKVDPVVTGWYDGIYVSVNGDGTFDFSTADGVRVDSVIVKGGRDANLYIYGRAVRSDHGLHAPENSKNGKYYGLSHLCFMTKTKKGEVSTET